MSALAFVAGCGSLALWPLKAWLACRGWQLPGRGDMAEGLRSVMDRDLRQQTWRPVVASEVKQGSASLVPLATPNGGRPPIMCAG